MESKKRILPADPRAGWYASREAVNEAIGRVLESGWYILGPEVEAFEREWAAYVGVGHAVGVASGTDAIELALRAAGIGPGDSVLTAANTVTATAAAIERTGATLVLGDVDPTTLGLDIPALEAWLGGPDAPQLHAVVPVHLYGHPVEMGALLHLARRHGFSVVEDAAQAHGAQALGRRVGGIGVAGAFSFYPTKNLGAFGDAGAVVTDDPAVAERVRALRQYGWRDRYVADQPGLNSRLDELQAAILRARLPRLDEQNRRRGEIASTYRAALGGIDGLTVVEPGPGASTAWHQFVVRTPRRDALRRHLNDQGILAAVLYPVPIHRQRAYCDRVRVPPEGLPEAERACNEVLSLPLYPELTAEEVARVISAVVGFFA